MCLACACKQLVMLQSHPTLPGMHVVLCVHEVTVFLPNGHDTNTVGGPALLQHLSLQICRVKSCLPGMIWHTKPQWYSGQPHKEAKGLRLGRYEQLHVPEYVSVCFKFALGSNIHVGMLALNHKL